LPELPEVELIRIGIEKNLLNQKLLRIHVNEPFSVLCNGSRMKDREYAEKVLNGILRGKILKKCQRKGKLLILGFNEEIYLTIHLKMTGNLIIESYSEGENQKHRRIIFEFEKEKMIFKDVRKFGYVEVISGIENLEKKLHALGPDALTELSDTKMLKFQLQRSSMPIKKFLLAQNYISGIGNAYADEILFEAGISPKKPANTLSYSEIRKLFKAIKTKLEEGISSGGLTLRDYRNLYGNRGRFQERLNVYNRLGQSCSKCGSSIERIKISGRSSFFCSSCQK
jgi:formamidopyrimidine-DNA glycosylase